MQVLYQLSYSPRWCPDLAGPSSNNRSRGFRSGQVRARPAQAREGGAGKRAGMAPCPVVLTLWSCQMAVAGLDDMHARWLSPQAAVAGTERVELPFARFWRPGAYPLANPHVQLCSRCGEPPCRLPGGGPGSGPRRIYPGSASLGWVPSHAARSTNDGQMPSCRLLR